MSRRRFLPPIKSSWMNRGPPLKLVCLTICHPGSPLDNTVLWVDPEKICDLMHDPNGGSRITLTNGVSHRLRETALDVARAVSEEIKLVPYEQFYDGSL